MTNTKATQSVIQETLVTPSIDQVDIFASQIGSDSWMSPIWNYVENDQLPEDEIKAKNVKVKSAHYIVIDGEIF